MSLEKSSLVVFSSRPQGEVVSQQLHNQRRVLIRVLRQAVELSNRLVERTLSNSARLAMVPDDLVIKHGDVERKAEANRVSRLQLLRVSRCLIVGVLSFRGNFLFFVWIADLCQVAVVVSLHLVVEHLRFFFIGAVGPWNQVIVKQGEHVLADFVQLCLDFLPVLVCALLVVCPFFFNAARNAPGRTLCSNKVFIGN